MLAICQHCSRLLGRPRIQNLSVQWTNDRYDQSTDLEKKIIVGTFDHVEFSGGLSNLELCVAGRSHHSKTTKQLEGAPSPSRSRHHFTHDIILIVTWLDADLCCVAF
jgi:hypothetical protein